MKIAALVAMLIAGIVLVIHLDDTPSHADLVLVNRAEVFTLDPQRMSWIHDMRTGYALYEGLVRWDPDDFTVVPAAAEWTTSDDGRTYTFTIRPDARWSNGDPVTAADFLYSWRRALLPDTAADYTSMFFAIEGAEAFFRWRSEALAAHAAAAGDDPAAAAALWETTERRFEETVGLSAPQERTLRVTLARPVPYFLDLVAFAPFLPVHPSTVERFVRLDPRTGRIEQQHGWTKPDALVCNGPYMLRQWRYNRGLHLERNPHYHSPDSVRSETIACLSIPDVNTAVLAFQSGRIDWLSEVGTEYEADMLAQQATGARTDIHKFPAFGTDFYSFNCRPTLSNGRVNPFADPRVRRAFVMAVDRQVLVEKVTRLDEPVQRVLVPPDSIAGYRSPEGLGHDPRHARQELAAAGWNDANPFPVVDLLYSTNTPRYRNLSLALRDMWQRELGVRVELRGKESKFFKEDLKRGNFMIGRGGWYGDYGDPTTFLDMCRTGDGNNDRGYSNPLVDDLLARAAAEADPRRRFDLLAECERIIVEDDVPMLVLCQYVQVYMYDPARLTGLVQHPRLTQYLWRMKADRR